MTTFAQRVATLTTQRATAGARYTAAVAELQAAMIDLAALDQALANSNVASLPLATFVDPPDSLDWQLAHPVYAPRAPLPNWRDAARTARDGYINSTIYGP